MQKPRICGVITTADPAIIYEISEVVDLFELRLDLIGKNWSELPALLNRPWIATCRLKSEGGSWNENEKKRKEELLKAMKCGAAMIDLELATPDLDNLVPLFKKRVKIIISHHNYEITPPGSELKHIIEQQFNAGADIAKVATLAISMDDNLKMLDLAGEFPNRDVVAINIGEKGIFSRILAPLAGSAFTYASAKQGLESAEGQISASELKQIYSRLKL